MPQLFAQLYDLSATGFFFDSSDSYYVKANTLRNDYGQRVEEFEIQFIDGDELDCALAAAIGLNQANFPRYFEYCEVWEDWQKTHIILAVGECGYPFDPDQDPNDYDIDIYHVDSLRAFARDLSIEYTEITIAGDAMSTAPPEQERTPKPLPAQRFGSALLH